MREKAVTSWWNWPISPCCVRVTAEWIRRKVCPRLAPPQDHTIHIFHQWKNFVTLCIWDGVCVHAIAHRTPIKHGFPFTTWKAWYANSIHERGNINMLLLHRHTASGTQPRFSCAHCRRAGNVSVNFTVNECSSPVCFIPMPASVYGISSNKMQRIFSNCKR